MCLQRACLIAGQSRDSCAKGRGAPFHSGTFARCAESVQPHVPESPKDMHEHMHAHMHIRVRACIDFDGPSLGTELAFDGPSLGAELATQIRMAHASVSDSMLRVVMCSR